MRMAVSASLGRVDVLPTLIWPAAAIAVVVLSLGLAHAPFLTVGATAGALLLVFALTKPLALVGLMLLIGPIDLSILTGGFKGMFEQLGGLDMNGIRLICMTAALSLVVLSEREPMRELFRPAALFYALLIAYCAGTLVFSPDPLEGLRLVFKIAYPLLVFLVIVGLAPRPERLERLMDAVLIGAVILCVIVNPLYLAFGDFEWNIGGWVRLRGVGAHQNPFAFYLIAMMLISFVRLFTRRQFRYLLLCILASLWMILTVTRIAFAAAVVALLAVGVVAAIATRQWRVLFGALVVGALLAVPFGPPVLERSLGFVPTPGELITLVRQPQALYSAINWEGRQAFWTVVFNAYMASPLLGLGMGASSFVLKLHFPGFSNPVVHNDYLRLLADAGVLGVLLFSVALLAWLGASLRSARADTRLAREYALPAVGCIAALSIIGLTDNAFDYYGPFTQYVGFLSAGAVVAAMWHRESMQSSEQEATT